MDITIKTIPHNKQRYETAGDYYLDNNSHWQFRVSEMGNSDYEFLVMIHELVEHHLADKARITNKEIDNFDIQYENERKEGMHGTGEEPGNDPNCPVYKQHQIATIIERLLCFELGIDWKEYDKKVMSLWKS